MSGKNEGDLLKKAQKLSRENKAIRKQLQDAKNYIDSLNAKDIDALVISGSKHLKVFTEKTADQVYRLFVENMNEGAVTLSSNGTILYCNLNFAAMVELPMQKVIGSKFKKFIDFSKDDFDALSKTGRVTAIKEEVFLQVNGFKTIPVLISVNALRLDDETVLSIILTDLTVQHR
ncbi:MAG: PAS domain-containing protein, partial [Bacteroidota bacterium]|nr:PAS domain-containing protein [Bacteroidota bacterium]